MQSPEGLHLQHVAGYRARRVNSANEALEKLDRPIRDASGAANAARFAARRLAATTPAPPRRQRVRGFSTVQPTVGENVAPEVASVARLARGQTRTSSSAGCRAPLSTGDCGRIRYDGLRDAQSFPIGRASTTKPAAISGNVLIALSTAPSRPSAITLYPLTETTRKEVSRSNSQSANRVNIFKWP